MPIVRVFINDITKHPCDAIVNAANPSLMRGGGVCGAIHDAAGPQLAIECARIKAELGLDWIEPGAAISTRAYNLPHEHVIHTVGPRSGQDPRILADCYTNAIREADRLGMRTIAFPAISANAYGVPVNISAPIIKDALENLETDSIEEIHLVFLNEPDARLTKTLFSKQ
jgi:O-acetyl-ADP-ribose deacetylase